jgi:lysophospholipase L1-like esterase
MKTWLIRLSVAFNILVIVTAAWAWANRRDFILDFLHPMHERKVTFFEAYPVQAGDVVFLGDSITDGAEWSELFPGVTTRNRGIGGDITTGVLARLHQITDGKPAAVFIKIGTNDLTHGPEDRDTSYAQYREIVDRIQRESPDTKIYLQSVLPRNVKLREEVEAYNIEIQLIAEATGSTYVDLYTSFLSEDGSIGDKFSNDELHLHGAGYVLWQQLISPYLEN